MVAVRLRDIRGYLTARCCAHVSAEKRGGEEKEVRSGSIEEGSW